MLNWRQLMLAQGLCWRTLCWPVCRMPGGMFGVCPLCSHALQGSFVACSSQRFCSAHKLLWRAGVLTKLDIMDPGTNARDVLDGQSVRLKHGWIGIVNRGQADIMSKVSIGLGGKPAVQHVLGLSPQTG